MSQRWPTLLAVALAAVLVAAPTPALAVDEVVGTGTPESCTGASLAAALENPAPALRITFDCGDAPATISVEAPLLIQAPDVTIDGGGRITLEGGGGRIVEHRTFGTIGSSRLRLRDMTIQGGRATGGGSSPGDASGANGAAVRSAFGAADPAFRPILLVEGVTFRDNVSTLTGVPAGRDAYDYGGGAIYSQGGAVVVRDSVFENNRANNSAGGAIHILQSSLTIERSVFESNRAVSTNPADGFGGAISIDGLGSDTRLFRVVGSRFAGNQAYNSGGAIHVNMYEDGSLAQIVDSSFVANAVIGGLRAQGGAIGGGGTSAGPGTGNPRVSISGSLFQGNSVRRSAGAGGTPGEDGSGGALAFPQRVRLGVVNSTFSANSAFGSGFNANGGALYIVNHTDQFSIESSTFADNYAGWVGGAISNSRVGSGDAAIPGGRVRNTIFANNSAGNGPNDWDIQQHCSSELAHDGRSLQFPPRLTGGNFFNDVTCFEGRSAPGQTGDPMFRDPLLDALADNGGPASSFGLLDGSPAIDTGAGCPALDQRGVGRPRGAGCDIGAFERIPALEVAPAFLPIGTTQRTLTLRGDSFGPASVVRVDGAPRTTVFVNSSTLRVTLEPGDVDVAAELSIQVEGQGSALGSAAVSVGAGLRAVYLPALPR